MGIPSLFDLLVVIALLAPGFVALRVIMWLAIIKRAPSEFEQTVASVILSLLGYAVFGYMLLRVGYGNLAIITVDDLRTKLLVPGSLAIYLVGMTTTGVGLGTISGLLLKHLRGSELVREGPWDSFGKSYLSKYVYVHTISGEEILGWVKRVSSGQERREIALGNPQLLIRKADRTIFDKIRLGSEILLTEKNVSRIIRVEVRKDSNVPGGAKVNV